MTSLMTLIQHKIENYVIIPSTRSETMGELVVGHRLEIIIDQRLESVASVDAIF